MTGIVALVDQPLELSLTLDSTTGRRERLDAFDDHTLMGFCKYCGDLIPKDLEKCRKCGGVAVSTLCPPAVIIPVKSSADPNVM